MRTRECDMESYGDLTAPCEGINVTVEACHEYDCLPMGKCLAMWTNLIIKQVISNSHHCIEIHKTKFAPKFSKLIILVGQIIFGKYNNI